MTPEIIAHRGASYLAPENTLSAFRKAMEIGADGVEMDVQQTSDKKLVIHHDYIIDLHTDISGKIYDMTEGELKELDFGSWKDIAYKDEKIATLEEALALCKVLDVARVQLEMKAPLLHSDAFVEQVVEQVRAAGLGEKLVLTSFNHDHLKLAKQQMPELQVGALLFGAVETLALPKGTWETLGLQNGLDEDEDEDDFPRLPVPTVENMDEENCRELTRWVNDKYSMLQAAFPNESLSGILSKLNRQRDPAQYIQTLDFPVEWVSCEYHTAYKKVSMVQKLHDLGVKTAFWTVDTEAALKDLWPLQPDAIVTNRPDRVREWSGELETSE